LRDQSEGFVISPEAVADDTHAIKCELAAETLCFSGQLRLRVSGWSMFPSVRPGDVLMIRRAGLEDICEGDIVLFRRQRRLFVHRVVKIDGCETVTRGDAMPAADDAIGKENLLGKVAFILRDGRCMEPDRSRGSAERAVSALVERSEIAARVVARVHALRQGSVSRL
jgi:signal peptidase I